MKQPQFYRVMYTQRVGDNPEYRSETCYERGRTKLLALIGECLSDKNIKVFTVDRIERDMVPPSILNSLEAA